MSRARNASRVGRRIWASQRWASAISALLFAACHRASDLTEQPRASTRPELSLRALATTADTSRLVVQLAPGTGTSVQVIGSLTGEIARGRGWRLAACSAPQGHPMLACNDVGETTKIAAAWIEGMTAGDLVTVTLVAVSASVGNTTTASSTPWTLSVQEVHAVSGASMLDALDVRREVRR